MTKMLITQVAKSVPFDNSTNGYIADNTQDAIEETKSTAGQARYAIVFAYNGNASNRWLELFQSNPSNDTPFVIAEPSAVVAMALSNSNDTATGTMTLYKNGVLLDDLSVTSGQTAYETGVYHLLSPGDELSVKVTAGSFQDPLFSPNIKVTA